MLGKPGFAIQERFFSDTFRPYLKHELPHENYYYFLEQSWLAWRLTVKKKDIQNMLFVEHICEQLYKNYHNDFPQLISYMLDQVHDSTERIAISEKEYYDARNEKEKDILKIFSASLRHYKVFFESEFRLWATIPYYFAVTSYGKKSGASTADTYVEVAGGNKYQTLKDIKLVIPQGDLKDFVDGFDNTIRNAGEGHDRYELTDNETIILHDIDPHTGRNKGKRELTQTDITRLIDKCRKTLWILRNGVMLFMANNPNFSKALSKIRPMKLREIEHRTIAFGETRWLKVKNFKYEKEKNLLSLELHYFEKHVGISSELIMGNGERYDLLDIESKVKYKHQVWGVLQNLYYIWSQEPAPDIDIKLFDDTNNCISDFAYSAEEMKKLLVGKRKYEPRLKRGSLTEDCYVMVGAIRVPYGTRKVAEAIAEKMGHNVRKLP